MNLVTSNYLLALADQTNIPQLKSFYRLRADVLEGNWCSKCKLSLNETGSLNCQTVALQPQSLHDQKLYEKLKRKRHLTQAQRKSLRKSKSYQQKLVKVCNACRNVTKIPVFKPSKPNKIIPILVKSSKKSCKRKKSIDFVIDIDGETPKPKKKMKKNKLNSSIIDITHSPIQEKNNNKVITELRQEIINKEKDITLGELSVKRKKKMKKKLSALKNCIESLNKERTSAKALLNKFLNSL